MNELGLYDGVGIVLPCVRCGVQYCYRCYSKCPSCGDYLGNKVVDKNTKKCNTPGCKNVGTEGFTISPGTFVVVCFECYDSISGQLEREKAW